MAILVLNGLVFAIFGHLGNLGPFCAQKVFESKGFMESKTFAGKLKQIRPDSQKTISAFILNQRVFRIKGLFSQSNRPGLAEKPFGSKNLFESKWLF